MPCAISDLRIGMKYHVIDSFHGKEYDAILLDNTPQEIVFYSDLFKYGEDPHIKVEIMRAPLLSIEVIEEAHNTDYITGIIDSIVNKYISTKEEYKCSDIRFEGDAAYLIEKEESIEAAAFLLKHNYPSAALSNVTYILNRQENNVVAFEMLIYIITDLISNNEKNAVMPIFPDQTDLYSNENVRMLRRAARELKRKLHPRIDVSHDMRFCGWLGQVGSRKGNIYVRSDILLVFCKEQIADRKLLSYISTGMNGARIEVEFTCARMPDGSTGASRILPTKRSIEEICSLERAGILTLSDNTEFGEMPAQYYDLPVRASQELEDRLKQIYLWSCRTVPYQPVGTKRGMMLCSVMQCAGEAGAFEGSILSEGNVYKFNSIQLLDKRLCDLINNGLTMPIEVLFEPCYNFTKVKEVYAPMADAIRLPDSSLSVPSWYTSDGVWQSKAYSEEEIGDIRAQEGANPVYSSMMPWLPVFDGYVGKHVFGIIRINTSPRQTYIDVNTFSYIFSVDQILDRFLYNVINSRIGTLVSWNQCHIEVMFIPFLYGESQKKVNADCIVLTKRGRLELLRQVWTITHGQGTMPPVLKSNLLFDVRKDYLPVSIRQISGIDISPLVGAYKFDGKNQLTGTIYAVNILHRKGLIVSENETERVGFHFEQIKDIMLLKAIEKGIENDLEVTFTVHISGNSISTIDIGTYADNRLFQLASSTNLVADNIRLTTKAIGTVKLRDHEIVESWSTDSLNPDYISIMDTYMRGEAIEPNEASNQADEVTETNTTNSSTDTVRTAVSQDRASLPSTSELNNNDNLVLVTGEMLFIPSTSSFGKIRIDQSVRGSYKIPNSGIERSFEFASGDQVFVHKSRFVDSMLNRIDLGIRQEVCFTLFVPNAPEKYVLPQAGLVARKPIAGQMPIWDIEDNGVQLEPDPNIAYQVLPGAFPAISISRNRPNTSNDQASNHNTAEEIVSESVETISILSYDYPPLTKQLIVDREQNRYDKFFNEGFRAHSFTHSKTISHAELVAQKDELQNQAKQACIALADSPFRNKATRFLFDYYYHMGMRKEQVELLDAVIRKAVFPFDKLIRIASQVYWNSLLVEKGVLNAKQWKQILRTIVVLCENNGVGTTELNGIRNYLAGGNKVVHGITNRGTSPEPNNQQATNLAISNSANHDNVAADTHANEDSTVTVLEEATTNPYIFENLYGSKPRSHIYPDVHTPVQLVSALVKDAKSFYDMKSQPSFRCASYLYSLAIDIDKKNSMTANEKWYRLIAVANMIPQNASGDLRKVAEQTYTPFQSISVHAKKGDKDWQYIHLLMRYGMPDILRDIGNLSAVFTEHDIQIREIIAKCVADYLGRKHEDVITSLQLCFEDASKLIGDDLREWKNSYLNKRIEGKLVKAIEEKPSYQSETIRWWNECVRNVVICPSNEALVSRLLTIMSDEEISQYNEFSVIASDWNRLADSIESVNSKIRNLEQIINRCDLLKANILNQPTQIGCEYLMPVFDVFVSCAKRLMDELITEPQVIVYEEDTENSISPASYGRRVINLEFSHNNQVDDLRKIRSVMLRIKNDNNFQACRNLTIVAETSSSCPFVFDGLLGNGNTYLPMDLDNSVLDIVFQFKVKEGLQQQIGDNFTFSMRIGYEYKQKNGETGRGEKRIVINVPVTHWEEESNSISNPFMTSNDGLDKNAKAYGRDSIINDLYKQIWNDEFSQYNGGCFIIYGQRRVGKTTVVKKLRERLEDDAIYSGRYIIVCEKIELTTVVVDRQLREGNMYRSFANKICEKAKDIIDPKKREALDDLYNSVKTVISQDEDPYEAFTESFLPRFNRLFDNQAAKPHIVLSIDEFNILYVGMYNGTISISVVNRLLRLFESCEQITLIIASADIYLSMSNLDDDLSNTFQHIGVYKLGGISHDSAMKMIRQDIQTINGLNAMPRFSLRCAETIYQWTGGNPYYIARICGAAIGYLNTMKWASMRDENWKDFINDCLILLDNNGGILNAQLFESQFNDAREGSGGVFSEMLKVYNARLVGVVGNLGMSISEDMLYRNGDLHFVRLSEINEQLPELIEWTEEDLIRIFEPIADKNNYRVTVEDYIQEYRNQQEKKKLFTRKNALQWLCDRGVLKYDADEGYLLTLPLCAVFRKTKPTFFGMHLERTIDC